MICATISSQSCFCWLYRASLSSASENINQADFGIDHMVMSMCRVFSFVGRGCLLWLVRSLGKTLLAFALLHFVLQGPTCLLSQVSLNFQLLHSSPLWWKGHLFGVLGLEGLVDLHRTDQLLQHYCLGHRLELLWYWMVCLGNEQRSLSFLRLHPSTAFRTLKLTMRATPFLQKEFVPMVVDIMVIWVKFTHSSPFEFTDS